MPEHQLCREKAVLEEELTMNMSLRDPSVGERESHAIEGAVASQGFMQDLLSAISSASHHEHALILLELDEATGPAGENSEAAALLPQLHEIVRGEDAIGRLASGLYAILLHECPIAKMTRMIATIDFLHSALDIAAHRDPARIGSTFLRPDDTPDRALSRAQGKLDRFAQF